MGSTATRGPARRRPRRPRPPRRGPFPCAVPAGATAASMAALFDAPALRTDGSSALATFNMLGNPGAAVEHRPYERPGRRLDARAEPLEHRDWRLRRDEILASDAAFLVLFAVVWVLSGFAAYWYALLTVGPA